MKVITKLRVVIFYPNKEHDICYATLSDDDCHWLKAYYAKGYEISRSFDSVIDLVVKWDKGKTADEFISELKKYICSLGFADARLIRIQTKSENMEKHYKFMKQLFPNTLWKFVEYETYNHFLAEANKFYTTIE